MHLSELNRSPWAPELNYFHYFTVHQRPRLTLLSKMATQSFQYLCSPQRQKKKKELKILPGKRRKNNRTEINYFLYSTPRLSQNQRTTTLSTEYLSHENFNFEINKGAPKLVKEQWGIEKFKVALNPLRHLKFFKTLRWLWTPFAEFF